LTCWILHCYVQRAKLTNFTASVTNFTTRC